jgi:mannose-6-phosphate isomerase-like protein (cupin superfamily)
MAKEYVKIDVDPTDPTEPKFLFDPYLYWCKKEGIPIAEDFGINMHKVETKPWARFDQNGAFVHLKGRGDFIAVWLLDIKPGGKTSPQQHMIEEVVLVLEGHGTTTVETQDGRKHTFEWGKDSLFALPLNCKYQHFNGSGSSKVRLASHHNLPLLLNVFHNEGFIFNNPYRFPEREGKESYFSGEGDFIPKWPGRHMWETNLVPDIANFELKTWDKRGGGSSNMMFVMADGTMHVHTSEMPVGTYKKGHRHGADFHVICTKGVGFSRLWYEADQEFVDVKWEHGVVFAPPDGMFHQHFNTGPNPARYLAIAYGGLRYPFTEAKRIIFAGMDVSLKDGGAQIEYEDQDPRIHLEYLRQMKKNGAQSKMGTLLNEEPYLKKLAAEG